MEVNKNILWTADETPLPKELWNRIEAMGYRVVVAESGEGPYESVERTRPGVWVGQGNGEPKSGLSVLKEVRRAFPSMPVVISSVKPSIEEAVEAIRAGATEYIPSSVEPERFWAALENVLPNHRVQVSSGHGNQLLSRKMSPKSPIAGNPEMIRLLDLAARIAASWSTVLIQGESGTGKEIIARFIHEKSNRASGPFVAVNCAALPENLLESELFGHEKGAFTGAISRKKGKFELAAGGTLLLDEISEIAMPFQAKLLRVLQEREVDRVGGQSPVAVDVRVLATTNRDLEKEVREGGFRQDLFYRLNVVPLHIPPLRKRPDDIALLARHFLKETASLNSMPMKSLTPEAEARLRSMPWPGNVRELENLMERAILLVNGERVESSDIDFLAGLGSDSHGQETDTVNVPVQPLREMEKRMILRALDDHQGNRTRASKVLGISVRTLRNKLNEYEKEAK